MIIVWCDSALLERKICVDGLKGSAYLTFWYNDKRAEQQLVKGEYYFHLIQGS